MIWSAVGQGGRAVDGEASNMIMIAFCVCSYKSEWVYACQRVKQCVHLILHTVLQQCGNLDCTFSFTSLLCVTLSSTKKTTTPTASAIVVVTTTADDQNKQNQQRYALPFR